MVKGSFWVFALRLANRGIGLLRKILLARLLAPSDFGLFGIALLAISTLETFSRIGFQGALIQKKGNIQSYLNTAWTAYAIRGIVLCIIVYMTAPKIALFFNSPQATLIIRLISFSLLINGFQNIGIILFRKELEFNKLFFYEISGTLVNFFVAVSLAFISGNVFALVWGTLAGSVLRLIMSYVVHDYRPRVEFQKDKSKEIFSFGSWTVASGILIFLINQGDDIVVGKFFGTAVLGIYQMAYTLSNLPTTEIARTINLVAFPAYSKLHEELPKLKEAFLKVLHATVFIALPMTILIFVFAQDFATLFLGSKWIGIVPPIQILVFAGFFRSLVAIGGALFVGIGMPKIDTFLQMTRFIIFASLIYPFSQKWGLLGISATVVISIAISALGSVYLAMKKSGCNINELIKATASPVIGSFVAVVITFFVRNLINDSLWQIILSMLLGITIYLLSCLLLNKLLGGGPEMFMKQITKKMSINPNS
jgi:O-antigen/teichoic acid export membrane protein